MKAYKTAQMDVILSAETDLIRTSLFSKNDATVEVINQIDWIGEEKK